MIMAHSLMDLPIHFSLLTENTDPCQRTFITHHISFGCRICLQAESHVLHVYWHPKKQTWHTYPTWLQGLAQSSSTSCRF
jgi:hypothetical protein